MHTFSLDLRMARRAKRLSLTADMAYVTARREYATTFRLDLQQRSARQRDTIPLVHVGRLVDVRLQHYLLRRCHLAAQPLARSFTKSIGRGRVAAPRVATPITRQSHRQPSLRRPMHGQVAAPSSQHVRHAVHRNITGSKGVRNHQKVQYQWIGGIQQLTAVSSSGAEGCVRGCRHAVQRAFVRWA